MRISFVRFVSVLFACFALSSCSHHTPKPDSNPPVTRNGKSEAEFLKEVLLATAPQKAYQDPNPEHITFAVVGINDFHGWLLPHEKKLQNGKVVKVGGASVLAAMIKILRDELQGRVLIVDAGDEWQGTLESNQTKGATVVHFYNMLGVRVAAIGNHEFDFNIENMRSQFKKAHYPYVASNIFGKKDGKRPQWENVFPSVLLSVGGYKFGVIGYSTMQTPGTTRYEYVSHLDFADPVKSVEDEAMNLRKKNANAVLVTAHAGSVCHDQNDERYGLDAWTLRDASMPETACDQEQEIVQLAHKLPANTVDGIVAGHTHQIMHHWLNGIPVVQDEAFNQFFNIIYFTFERKTKKLLPELTKIEGLIPICSEVFDGTNHCDVRKVKADASQDLVPAAFHGVKIVPDAKVEAWLEPIRKSTDKYRKQVLGFSELPLNKERDKEFAMGNLVADALRDYAKSDFSLVNSGGIRTSLEAGAITYDGLYRALPFDNLLNVVHVKGKEIRMLYRVATSGSHGIVAFSGLKLKLIPYNKDAPRTDLNGDGKKEVWESNRLKEITLSDGSPIEDEKMYSVATFDFLVNGGDDYIWFMSQLKPENIDRTHNEYCRTIVMNYLKKHQLINTKDFPLVDPKNPRVVFSE